MRKKALRRLRDQLLDNGYKKSWLNKLIFSTPINQENLHSRREHQAQEQQADTIQTNVTNNIENNRQVFYSKLPYIENLTNKITKIFKDQNCKFALFNLITNNRFFTNKKDRIPDVSKSDLVYEIKCTNCNLPYIGQTSQCLKQRLTLHKSDIKLRPHRCALAKHIKDSKGKCEADFNNVKILAYENNLKKRSFLEMCYINERHDTINAKSDINNLSQIYNYLLEIDKNRNRIPNN